MSNNLREVEKVIDSEAVLIGGKALDAEKQEVLDELLFRFEAVKAASGKKYILMTCRAHSSTRCCRFCRASRVRQCCLSPTRTGVRYTPFSKKNLLENHQPTEGCRR